MACAARMLHGRWRGWWLLVVRRSLWRRALGRAGPVPRVLRAWPWRCGRRLLLPRARRDPRRLLVGLRCAGWMFQLLSWTELGSGLTSSMGRTGVDFQFVGLRLAATCHLMYILSTTNHDMSLCPWHFRDRCLVAPQKVGVYHPIPSASCAGVQMVMGLR